MKTHLFNTKPLLSSILAAVVVLLGLAYGHASDPLTIVTVGDSTMADYRQEDIKRGWGQVFGDYLDPSSKVINLALSGRSTKTFFDSGNWQKALAAKPDFVFIQFGHNDSHPKDKPESTDADTDYIEYLRRYVKEAREAGGKPILVTPMHRLTFDKNTGKMTQELKPYADAMKRVAEEMKAPVIDLYTLSGDVFGPMGESGVAGMTQSNTDRTHFTEKGARIIAKLVAEASKQIDPGLNKIEPTQDNAVQP
jgi:lysophospholipase L1-like esterase